ncbi:MAG: response regulator, partial [Candidatus Aenigmatarchaeota archaeon]
NELLPYLENLKKEGKIRNVVVGGLEYWYLIQKSPKKILIVEDDENILKLISLTLQEYERKEVKTGEEAIEEFEKMKPDLVILDLMLPGLNGLEVCKKIKKENKDTIIIIVSAADPVVNRFFGIQYGADYYIKKPFDPIELKTLVDVYLARQNFDPLIDLPDFERLRNIINLNSEEYRMIKVEINGIQEYTKDYGEKESKKIFRLVSSIISDKIKENEVEGYVGFLVDSFFIIFKKEFSSTIEKVLSETRNDFSRIATFLKQKHRIGIDILGEIEKQKQKIPLEIEAYEVNLEALLKKFEIFKFPENENLENVQVRNYTLAELNKIFAECKLDVKLGELGGTPRIYIGKKSS